jgi:hypothetical protein
MLQMFDQPETALYLYMAGGEFTPMAMRKAEERNDIQMRRLKRPFYLHRAGDDHSFGEIKEASSDGVEYKQVTLRLTEKQIRELTIQQYLDAEKATKQPDASVLILKPSFGGFGIDLKELWKRWHKKRYPLTVTEALSYGIVAGAHVDQHLLFFKDNSRYGI